MGKADIPEVPGRSQFTNKQREYLFGEDFEPDRERQLRYNIRKNIQSALMDLQLLDNLEERDRIQAFNPLSSYYEFEGIADWVKEENFDLASTDAVNGDSEIGGLMHQGLADLLTWYILYYGPGAFVHLGQQALNKATVTQAKDKDEDIGAYELSLSYAESVSDVVESE